MESIPQNSKIKPQTNKTNPIFDLIINKKETAEDLRNEFSYDSIVNITEEEKSKYKKIGLEDGYYLTNIDFLKKAIDSIEFQVYYKISYGSEREKLVRIKRKDSVLDLSLAFTGGDGGQSWQGDTEFLNDSIFQKVNVFTETTIDNTHLMAYSIDSIRIKYKYDEKLNYKEIKKDSFRTYTQHPIYHKNLKDKIFKLWSAPFRINEINCQWEYEVKYKNETDEKSTDVFVSLLGQKLINFKTKKVLLNLDLDDFFFIFSPVDISILDNNNFENRTTGNLITYPAPYSYTNDSLDINKDGFYDFQFLTEIAAAGANTYYKVYLFNPKNNQFDYSEVFSDYNIKYDLDKNRTSSFMKSGAGNYYYQFKNLKKNRKDVEFVENVHHYSDTIFYEKLINDKVVLEKKIILGEDWNWEKYLERK